MQIRNTSVMLTFAKQLLRHQQMARDFLVFEEKSVIQWNDIKLREHNSCRHFKIVNSQNQICIWSPTEGILGNISEPPDYNVLLLELEQSRTLSPGQEPGTRNRDALHLKVNTQKHWGRG